MNRHHWIAVSLAIVVLLFGAGHGQAAPPGEAVIAWHVTIAPTWFDPSSAPPQITPFGILYAIHDALVRPLRTGSPTNSSSAGASSSTTAIPSPRRT
jgi:hypothetical protein